MSLTLIKAKLIINAKKAGAKKGWSDAARKKAALTRKAKKKSGSAMYGMGSPKKKTISSEEFYVKRTKYAQGAKLVDEQKSRATEYRHKSNDLYKKNPKRSDKYLTKAEQLEGMAQRNEQRLKKMNKKYGILKNPY